MERQDAAMAQKNQYRTSADQKQNRKIEEEYSMFDEHNVDEDELEDIIEQPIEEESGDGESEDDELAAMGDATAAQALAESRAQRMMSKEELIEVGLRETPGAQTYESMKALPRPPPTL